MCADIEGSYCLVLLLGNQGVTVWCNGGYEHIRHSLRLYQKENRVHWSLWGLGVVSSMSPTSPLAFSPTLCWSFCSSHTQRSVLAPRYLSTLNNCTHISARRAFHNCFPSLLLCFLSEAMNGCKDIGYHLSWCRHFYETKIPMGDPWRSGVQERGQT